MIAGSQPEFSRPAYDSQGGEKKVAQQPTVGSDGKVTQPPEPEQEKTFMQKYWWYIIIGFLVLQTLGTTADPENKRGQGGGGRAAP